MSETWHGINVAEIRKPVLKRLNMAAKVFLKLIDSGKIYILDTDTTGAVIVSNNYLSWKFISPENYQVPQGATIGDALDSLITITTNDPVARWDAFVSFFKDNRSTINMFLSEGGSATITDATGTTYSGTSHKFPAITTFPALVAWLKTWCGADFLSADSQKIHTQGSSLQVLLTTSGTTITCNFVF